MAGEKQAPLVPKRRFPEFKDSPEWQSTVLERLAARRTQRNGSESKLRPLTNSAEFGVVDQRAFFEKDIATNTENYFVIEEGDYVYNPRVSSIAPVGPISKNRVGSGVMSPLYTIFRFKSDKFDFFAHFFASTHWHPYLRRVSNSGVRHDRMAITNEDLMLMPIPLPQTEAEQQKIADCLGSLDDLIVGEGRKLDALRQHKKGLMQQLFPRAERIENGQKIPAETVPRLRFPEFQGAGDWEGKECGSLFANRIEKGVSGLPLYSVTIHDGMVRRDTFDRNYYDIEDAAGNKRASKGDIAYNMMRMWQGALGVALEDCMVSPAYIVLKPKQEVVPSFFANYLKTASSLQQLTAHSRGLTKDRLRLYFDDFASIRLRIPPVPEQEKIALFLTSLDKNIIAQLLRVETLKLHKHGLLQQLFPSLEGHTL